MVLLFSVTGSGLAASSLIFWFLAQGAAAARARRWTAADTRTIVGVIGKLSDGDPGATDVGEIWCTVQNGVAALGFRCALDGGERRRCERGQEVGRDEGTRSGIGYVRRWRWSLSMGCWGHEAAWRARPRSAAGG